MGNNDLDSLIPEAPKTGSVEDLIPDHNDLQRSGLQGSMFVAGQTDPDKMSEAVNLATKFNVEPMFAHDNLPELKKADAAKNTDYENLIQNYPGTTNFLQKPENAALSHDDLDSLNQIDHATQIVSKKNGFIDDLGTSIHSGFNDLQRAVISLGVAHGLLDKDEAAANLESLSRDSAKLDALKPDYLKDFQAAMSENKKDLGAALSQIGQGYEEAKNGSLTAAMKDFAGGSVSTVGALLDFAKTMAVSPRASLYTGVESSVPIAPMLAGGTLAGIALPAIAGGGAAAATIGTIGGSFMGGAPIFIGQKFDQKMQEKGLDPKNPEDLRTAYSDPKLMSEFRDQADKYGLTFGALTSLFSGLGGVFAKEGVSIAEPGIASALKSGAETAGRFAAGAGLQSAGLATGQAAGEVAAGEKPDIAGALQNAVLMLGQGAAIEALALGKKGLTPRETVEGQIINPPGETPEAPIYDVQPEQKLLTTSKREAYSPNPTEAIQQVAHDTQSAVHALQGLQALDEMGGAVKGSKLAERVPDKIEELVKVSGGNGNVFFQSNDWDKYWTKKGLSPAKAAEQIMGDASAYLEAKETGQDLAVPLAKYVSKIAPTEHYEALLNFVKTEPNGMKFEDAKAHMESVPETVSKISQEAGQTKDEAKTLADRAYDQLVAAGRSPEEAKAASQIIESRLKTRSEITGISPKEYFEKYGFEVTGERGSALAEQPTHILNQSAINSKDFARLQELKNESSNGMVPAKWEELARLEEKALPSDEKSKMKRAKAMGFDTKKVWYHGTNGGDFNEFRNSNVPGIAAFFTAKPSFARKFIEDPYYNDRGFVQEGSESPKVYAVHLKTENTFDLSKPSDLKKLLKVLGDNVPDGDRGRDSWEFLEHTEVIEAIKSLGYDSMFTREDGVKNIAVFDANQIRSVGANFDPAEAKSANIYYQGPNDAGPRGQIEFGPYKALITLGEKADASTFIHESFHLWTKEFQDDFNHLKNQSSLNARQKQFMADAQSLLSYVGADSFESMKAEQWEKIAESGEEYLRDGKAPTAELQGAFARFKTWISYLYRAFKNNGIKLSDDIRGVFDRMLASQDESSKEVVSPLFKEPATAGMSEAQAQKYVQLQSELRQHSEDQLRSSLLKDLERRQSKDYKTERAKIKAHVTDTVNNDPVYRALSVLKDGTLPDGSELPEGTFPMKLSKESVIEEYGKDYVSGLPSGIFDKESGLPADMVAESFGFRSGDDLLHSLANAPTKKSTIEALTDEGMEELYPDLTEQPQLSDEAVKAAHNDRKSEMLRMELEHLASDRLPQFKETIRNISRRVPTDLEVRNKAQAILSKIPISQISSYTYELAERKAAKEAGENLAKGDLEGAYQAKNRELLNHELYKAAALAKESVQKAEEIFRKVAQKDEDIAKNRDTDLVNAARALLSQYGLGRTKKTPLEYLEKIRAYDPEKFATLSDMIGPVGPTRDYRSLPLEDFMNLKYSFDALWSLAKSENQILVEGKMMDRVIAAEAIKSDLAKFDDKKRPEKYNRSITSFEKQKMDLESALASGRIVESLIDQWSESNIDSNLRKILFDPVNQGAEGYHEASLKVQSQLKEILEPISKTLKMKKIEAPEIGYTFGTKAEVLGALLHTGNESNLSKLLRGRGWGEYDEEGNLNRSRWDAFVSRMQREGILTKADYDFAQNVWDLFEGLKKEAQVAYREQYGHYFEEISAKPFRTSYGEYRGGYVPAKVDPYENRAAEIREEKAAFEKIENSWAFPTTGRGFTKSRIDAYAAPLNLSLTHLPGALDWELRFIHIEPKVKQTARLLWDKEVRDSVNAVHPYAVKDILVPWLQRTASQQITFPGNNRFLDRSFRYLKSSTQMQYLMFNVASAAKRISGVGTALVKVPAEHLLPAFFEYATSPRASTKSIQERSAFMRVHTSEQLAEVKEAIQKIEVNPNQLVRAHEIAKPYTSLLIKSVQHVLDNTVWLGAYNHEMSQMPKDLTIEEMQERAARKADSAVRLTQGSSFPEHVSRWATGTPGQQLIKMFVNHFNTIGNLQVSEQSQARTLKRSTYVFATGFMAFAVAGELISAAVSGGSDKDKKESALGYLLRKGIGGIVGVGTSFIPTAGPIANSAYEALTSPKGRPADFSVELSPAASGLASGVHGLGGVSNFITKKKALTGRNIQDLFTMLGVASGLPLTPASKPISYMTDLKQNRVEKPNNPLELVRGLVTGRATPKK